MGIEFSPSSYGFRSHRSAYDAIRKCDEYISDGQIFTADMDLKNFFDTVSHSKHIEVLSRTIKNGCVISLIHKYLNVDVMLNGRIEETSLGVPLAGLLSPLLGNLMLNEFGKELERGGHLFVRYADELVIFCMSRKSSKRIYEHIIQYRKQSLHWYVRGWSN